MRPSALPLLCLAAALAASAAARADTLVVLNKAADTATLLDLASGRERATLAVGAGPHEAAVSPDGRWALVANYGRPGAPGQSMSLVDVAAARVVATHRLGRYDRPHGIAWHGDTAWVTAEGQRALVGWSARTGERVAVLPTDQAGSHMVALHPDGSRAYVSNLGDDSVTVFDLDKGERVGVWKTGDGAEGIAVSPDGRELWVGHRDAGDVAVFDALSGKELARLPAAGFPIRVTITPDGARVLVSCAEAGLVRIYDRAARRHLADIRFDREAKDAEGRLFGDRFGKSPLPIGIVVPPTGNRAYVALASADAVAEVDLGDYRVRRWLPTGKEPDGMAWSPVVVSDTANVVELDIASARAGFEAGTLTAESLASAYLDRIAAIDRAGPRLNSVIELNPAALDEARARDAERAAGKVRGPLHGIPVLLKDNIDVAGLVNSAGSLALANHRPKDDAFLVARLRGAGAVVLGKTNLSEWANFRSNHSSSGWSSRGGQTRNPYALERNPCGSSSGTGAAIAASLATVGVGTETDGSILCPSAVNGLVGLKPTVGLVSRDGIIPISATQDTAGPMARTVADAAALLQVLVAHDPADPAATRRATVDYLSALDAKALAGKRIGVLRQAMGRHPAVDAATESALEALRMAGADVVDVTVPTWGQWGQAEFEVLLHEFKAGLDDYLRESDAPVASLEALIAWNDANAAAAMPFFGQDLLVLAQAKPGLDDKAYREARDTARRLARDEGLLAVLNGQKLDALVAPTTGPAWPTDHVLGDHFVSAGYGMAAVAGTPSLTVPMGDASGLPLGLAFLGRPYSEAELLALGYAFEQATRARRPPGFAPGATP